MSDYPMASDGPPPCHPRIFQEGTTVTILADIGSNAVETWVRKVAAQSGQPVDWHYVAGRVAVKALGDLEQVHAALMLLLPEYTAARERKIQHGRT